MAGTTRLSCWLSGLLFEPEAFGPAMAKVMDIEPAAMKKMHADFLAKIAQSGGCHDIRETDGIREQLQYRLTCPEGVFLYLTLGRRHKRVAGQA